MTQANRTQEQVKAQLKWVLACEHLEFALNPPPGTLLEASNDLPTAIERASEALNGLKMAFDAGPAVRPLGD